MRGLASNRAAICVLLAAGVFLTFVPSLRNGFVGYDDGEYVTDNTHVNTGLTPRNVAWAFTAAHSSNWHPLTWLSHALDSTLFGTAPAGHHFTSLLLHVANTLLLFLWLSSATGFTTRSAFVAAVFGLHPLHVESVAWVAARKDVLSTLFGMLMLIAYAAYVKRPGIARYSLAAVCFAASLLSKQMLVTAPVLLLLLDWWPLRRPFSWRLVLEKLPLIVFSLAAAGAAFWAQRMSGSISSIEQLPLAVRLSNAVVSYFRYVAKTVWPIDLAVFYPFPKSIPIAEVTAAWAAIIIVSVLAFAARRRRPWLTVGWAWYLLTLLPVIGIVQVGMQAMADRYMYVPMIGLLIAVTWGCSEAWGQQRLLTVAAGLMLVACAAMTWRQVHVWKDGLTLFTHAVEVTPDNFVAHDNLGVELDRRGHSEEALAQYRETLRIQPGDHNGEQNYAMANFAKGERLFAAGHTPEALAAFQEGIRYRPGNAMAHTYAGAALARTGNAIEAKREFEEAIRYDPSNVEARYDLGLTLAALGQNAAALEALDAALRIKPDYGPALAARPALTGRKR